MFLLILAGRFEMDFEIVVTYLSGLFFFFYLIKQWVLLLKALACDRLPKEIWCSQQILAWERSSRAYMKFEHQISEGTYPT